MPSRSETIMSLLRVVIVSLVKYFLYILPVKSSYLRDTENNFHCVGELCAMSLSIAERTAHTVLHNYIIMGFCGYYNGIMRCFCFLLLSATALTVTCTATNCGRLMMPFSSHVSIKIPPFHGGCCAKWCQLPKSRQKLASKGWAHIHRLMSRL